MGILLWAVIFKLLQQFGNLPHTLPHNFLTYSLAKLEAAPNDIIKKILKLKEIRKNMQRYDSKENKSHEAKEKQGKRNQINCQVDEDCNILNKTTQLHSECNQQLVTCTHRCWKNICKTFKVKYRFSGNTFTTLLLIICLKKYWIA